MAKAFFKLLQCATLWLATHDVSGAAANDNFSNATVLPPVVLGLRTDYSGEGATLESWEINQLAPTDGIGTVWWKWTPTISGETEFESRFSDLWVYRRNEMNELTLITRIRSGSALGGGSFQGMTCEAGVTYWIRAASGRADSWWWIGQRLQGLEIEKSSVGHAAAIRLTNSLSLPAPLSLRMVVQYQPNISVLGWLGVGTNELTSVAFGKVWEWTGAVAANHVAIATATYGSGESWTRGFNFLVRTVNDDFRDATEIPATFEAVALPFRTTFSTEEEGEPAFPNGKSQSVWWRWSPSENKEVRIRAEKQQVEVFTGSTVSNLTRIAHNDGRASQYGIYEGWTAVSAKAGETYFIRVSDVQVYSRTGGMVEIEPLNGPMRGYVLLSNHSGTEILGRILEPDGTANFRPELAAQFYGGASVTNLSALTAPQLVSRGLTVDGVEIPGLLSHGIFHTPVSAGEQYFVQLRVWDNATHYEAARPLRRMVGKSKIMSVTAGSEFTGPAILSEIGDIKLFSVTNFVPGRFTLENKSEQSWRVSGFQGTYLIEAGNLTGEWSLVATVNTWTGDAMFRDARTHKPSAVFYRARLVD